MTKLEEVLQQINEYGIADEVKSAILAQEDNKNTKKKNKGKIHAVDRNTETAISAILNKYPIAAMGWRHDEISLILEKNIGAANKGDATTTLWQDRYCWFRDMCFQPFFYV
jgi:hypothetical protein